MKKKNIIIIGSIFLVSFILYLIMSIIVSKNGGNPLAMDIWARDTAYQIRGEKGGFGYWFFRIITEAGYTYFVCVLVACFLVYTKLDSRFLVFGLGVLLECILNAVFKGMYQRERPLLAMRWMYESSTSFPSGHSTTAGYVYAFIIYTILDSKYGKKIQISGIAIAAFLMLIVPISRIILGMHYLSDCIAGLMLGIMTSLGMITLHQILKYYSILPTGVIRWNKKK